MRQTPRALLVWLLLAAVPALSQSRDERWRADLDALQARILSTHPNPFTRTSPDAFEQRVADVRARIPGLTDPQVVVELAGIVAMLNDGHSGLLLSQPGTGVRRYPLGLRWFSDGLYVTSAPETASRIIGSRVVSMNGQPVALAYEAVRPWLSYDTDEWARYQSETALATHEILVAAGLAALDGPLAIEAESPGGGGGQRVTEMIALGPVPVATGPVAARLTLPLSRRAPGLEYWFEWLENERALYIQYNRCRENALLPVRGFVDEILAFSLQHRPETWIFDLRENPGGNEIVFIWMYTRMEEAVRGGRMPVPWKGVYGIIGNRTFSSGVLAAKLLKSKGAVMIGEATGGRADWFGNTPAWTLPNSRLTVAISQRIVGDGTGRPVVPNEPIEFNGVDYFRFQDPYLDHALLLGR